MPLTKIDSPDDERLSGFRDIRERDLLGRHGLFIAEGKVVLRVLADSQTFGIEAVLVLESQLGTVQQILADRADVSVFVVGQEIMDGVTGFHVHRGVLALGRRRNPLLSGDLLQALPPMATILICIGISNHDNIGSIFRNAAALGCDAILLDQTCCDPLYRKSLRVSVGGVLKVPFARFEDRDVLLRQLNTAGFQQLALAPKGTHDIGAVTSTPRRAIYLGAEGDGLPAAILQAVQTVKIPMAAGFDSLNVASASAIALHRLVERM